MSLKRSEKRSENKKYPKLAFILATTWIIIISLIVSYFTDDVGNTESYDDNSILAKIQVLENNQISIEQVQDIAEVKTRKQFRDYREDIYDEVNDQIDGWFDDKSYADRDDIEDCADNGLEDLDDGKSTSNVLEDYLDCMNSV